MQVLRGTPLTVHWRSDCTYAQAIKPSNREGMECSLQELQKSLKTKNGCDCTICRTCVANELDDILKLMRVTPYRSPIRIGPGLQAEFLDAGHIPGSASVLFSVTVGGKEKKFLFSGDLGNEMSALFPGPRPAPNVDAVFVETTYGPKPRSRSVNGEREVFRNAVADAVRNGGSHGYRPSPWIVHKRYSTSCTWPSRKMLCRAMCRSSAHRPRQRRSRRSITSIRRMVGSDPRLPTIRRLGPPSP